MSMERFPNTSRHCPGKALTRVRKGIEVAANEHRRLLRRNALSCGHIHQQLVELVGKHHALDQLNVAEPKNYR